MNNDENILLGFGIDVQFVVVRVVISDALVCVGFVSASLRLKEKFLALSNLPGSRSGGNLV